MQGLECNGFFARLRRFNRQIDPFHWLTLWTGASRQTSNRYAM